MRKLSRRLAITGAAALGLGACAPVMRVGDGKKEPRGGIGGTGIIGTLTDFGSLLVNGARIDTDSATAVTDAFGAAEMSALGIGHTLTIEAEIVGGTLSARRVHVSHPVIGRVEELSGDGRRARVAGVQVAAERDMVGRLAPGARVAVSGLWNGGSIVASRVDPLDGPGPSVLAGVVQRARSGLAIGGVPLDLPADLDLPVGGFVTVAGTRMENLFQVDRVVRGRFTGAAGPLVALSVEGYLRADAEAPFYAISGLGHSFDREARVAAFQGKRTLFEGPCVGTFAAETGLVLPEHLGDRRALLRQVVDGQAPRLTIPAR